MQKCPKLLDVQGILKVLLSSLVSYGYAFKILIFVFSRVMSIASRLNVKYRVVKTRYGYRVIAVQHVSTNVSWRVVKCWIAVLK